MSDCHGCDTPICVGGKNYNASIMRTASGAIISAQYLDENFNLTALAPGTFTFGACSPLTVENEILSGGVAPTATPVDPTEKKLWLNTVSNTLTHWWNPATNTWIPLRLAPDVFPVTQPLVAGNNVITHNLGSAPVEVQVRNAATGAIISHTIPPGGETANAVTIFVPVAVASAIIRIDA